MNKRKLGRTNLEVSEVGFGCWAIGGQGYGQTKDEESMDALSAAWDNGVNFFDTADTYGFGHSEELVAKLIKNKPRDQYVLATKVGWDFYSEGGSKKNFDPEYIKSACDKSLGRLGLDHIDVYQLHNPTEKIIREGACLAALEELKKQGKIRFIGISVHTEEDAKAAIDDERVDTLQLELNILEQKMVNSILAEAKERDKGIIVREPMACGLLTGKYEAHHEFSKDDHRRRWIPEKRVADEKKIEKVRKILATDRMPLSQAAIEFTLDFEEVSTVIPGAKTREQVLQNVRASLDPELRSQESHKLRELYNRQFPSP